MALQLLLDGAVVLCQLDGGGAIEGQLVVVVDATREALVGRLDLAVGDVVHLRE